MWQNNYQHWNESGMTPSNGTMKRTNTHEVLFWLQEDSEEDTWDEDWISVTVCRSGEDKQSVLLCAPLNSSVSVWINKLSDFSSQTVTVSDSDVSLMHHDYKNTISSVYGVNEQSRGHRGVTSQRMKFPLLTRRRHYSNRDCQEQHQWNQNH